MLQRIPGRLGFHRPAISPAVAQQLPLTRSLVLRDLDADAYYPESSRFGAKGGTADDTTALQNCCDAAAVAGKTVVLRQPYKVTDAGGRGYALKLTQGLKIVGLGVSGGLPKSGIIPAAGYPTTSDVIRMEGSSAAALNFTQLDNFTIGDTGLGRYGIAIITAGLGHDPQFGYSDFSRLNIPAPNGGYSFAHLNIATTAITAITKANPAVVTAAGHGIINGDLVLTDATIGGMTQIRSKLCIAQNVATNTLELIDTTTGAAIDSTAYTTYTSGGFVTGSASTGGMYLSRLRDSFLLGAVNMTLTGSANIISHNEIAGNVSNVALLYSQIAGGVGIAIESNNIADPAGAIKIDSGLNVRIRDNSIEMGSTIAGSNGAVIDLNGGVDRIHGALIEGNSIGNLSSNAAVVASLRVNLADQTIIGPNTWYTTNTTQQGGSGEWVQITGAATDTDFSETQDYILPGAGREFTNAGATTRGRSIDVAVGSVASGSGTITTVGTKTCRYIREGNRVRGVISVAITTNGTGGTYVSIQLPYLPKSNGTCAGMDVGVSGFLLEGQLQAGYGFVLVQNYNNTYPAQSGSILVLSFEYEINS